ncbi:hypothetical protein D5b_00438 [Faustovirus]|nr:hypothetical protein D5b_00438 [Faustovirus]
MEIIKHQPEAFVSVAKWTRFEAHKILIASIPIDYSKYTVIKLPKLRTDIKGMSTIIRGQVELRNQEVGIFQLWH